MDAVLVIDQELVTEAVRLLAMNTISAYRSGVSMKWNDAELGIYMIYIFGEINKCKDQQSPFKDYFKHFHSRRRQGASSILSCACDTGQGEEKNNRLL